MECVSALRFCSAERESERKKDRQTDRQTEDMERKLAFNAQLTTERQRQRVFWFRTVGRKDGKEL